jgi:Protein of unknown function (DUF2799)
MNHVAQVSRIAFAVFVLAALGGCATLSEGECRMGDWFDIGFRDGRQGRPADRITDHVKACAEYGTPPDRERYLDGHFAGLGSYCTAHNGLALGRAGRSYHGVCATHDERAFMSGYSLGNSLHRAHVRLDSIIDEIASVEATLKDKESSDEERDAAIYRRVQLEGERGAAAEEVDRLEFEAQSF